MTKASVALGIAILWLMAQCIAPVLGQEINLPTTEQLQQLHSDALRVLSSILRDPQSKDTDRLTVVNALVQSGSRDAVHLLAEALLSDPAPFVRRAAAEGLGQVPLYGADLALRRAALTDPIASIRWASGVSLVRWIPADSGIIERLLRDPSTLAAAALSLQDATNTSMFPLSLWPLTAKAMTAAFSDRGTYNIVERAAMLKMLAQMNAVNEIPLLRQTLAAPDEDPFVRGAAAFALGVLEVREAVPDLIVALESGLEALQLAAAGALGRLNDERALQPLSVTLLEATSAGVRAAAATALASFGAAAIPVLEESLQTDDSPIVRQVALVGMTGIGGPEAVQAVLSFVNSGFLQTCEPSACGSLALESLVSLARLGQGALAVQLLERTLAAVREVLPLFYAFAEHALVRVLVEVGRVAPETFDLLLEDESPFLQALGLAALAEVRGRSARETLLRYVAQTDNVVVRRAALEGLSKWAIHDDVAILIPEITNRDRRSRAAALSALTRVGDIRALQPLSDALNSAIVAIHLDAAGAALKFSQRIFNLDAALNCEFSHRPSPDRALVCLER